MEIMNENKLDSIIETLKFNDTETNKIQDVLLSKYLRYVHILGQLETKASKGNGSANLNDLFYSRYYWFNKFRERYFSLYGHDEGLEQQSFKMLSDFNEEFPEKVDWSIIEQIETGSI
jgi:hypothetical protein